MVGIYDQLVTNKISKEMMIVTPARTGPSQMVCAASFRILQDRALRSISSLLGCPPKNFRSLQSAMLRTALLGAVA